MAAQASTLVLESGHYAENRRSYSSLRAAKNGRGANGARELLPTLVSMLGFRDHNGICFSAKRQPQSCMLGCKARNQVLAAQSSFPTIFLLSLPSQALVLAFRLPLAVGTASKPPKRRLSSR